MENITNTKLRLTIVAWIMGILIVALSGTLIGVLATSSRGLGSNFSISYDIGENVGMKFRYKVNGQVQNVYFEDPASMPEPAPADEDGYVTFDTGSSLQSPFFNNEHISEELQLSPEKTSVTIEFDIVNITSSPLYVGWQDGVIANGNISIEMYLNGGFNFLDGPTKINPTSVTQETIAAQDGENDDASLSIKFVVTASEVNSGWTGAEFICAMVVASAISGT